jgi:hypothetical protein
VQNLAGNAAYADVRADLQAFWQGIRDRDDVRWNGILS